MARGTVAFFHDEDGYGFIETDDADDDVFFHVTDVPGPDPEEGDELNSILRRAIVVHAQRISAEFRSTATH